MTRLTKPKGPYLTTATTFDRGTKPILVIVGPHTVGYRTKGSRQVYELPHEKVFLLAVRAAAEAERSSRPTAAVKRGTL